MSHYSVSCRDNKEISKSIRYDAILNFPHIFIYKRNKKLPVNHSKGGITSKLSLKYIKMKFLAILFSLSCCLYLTNSAAIPEVSFDSTKI